MVVIRSAHAGCLWLNVKRAFGKYLLQFKLECDFKKNFKSCKQKSKLSSFPYNI